MNKNILITGGSRGLGYELVKVFHSNNYKVFTIVRNKHASDKLNEDFSLNVFPIITDITSDGCIEVVKTKIKEHTDKIDILINNAGVPGTEWNINKVATQEVNDLFNVHCLGVIRIVQAALEFLVNSTNPKIINVSSRLGSLTKVASDEFKSINTSYSYRIAKAAQNMLTICMQQELKYQGIYVGAIHPGRLKTDSASSDADMEACEAAKNIFQWVEGLKVKDSIGFVQPLVGDLPW